MSDYDQFSEETTAKARRIVDTDKVTQDAEHPEIFWVLGSKPGTTYRVQIGQGGSFVTCTCPHGMHAGGGMTRCYHACAALIQRDRATIRNNGFGKDD